MKTVEDQEERPRKQPSATLMADGVREGALWELFLEALEQYVELLRPQPSVFGHHVRVLQYHD